MTVTNLDGAASLRRAREVLESLDYADLSVDQKIAYAHAHAETSTASATARGFVELGRRMNSAIELAEEALDV